MQCLIAHKKVAHTSYLCEPLSCFIYYLQKLSLLHHLFAVPNVYSLLQLRIGLHIHLATLQVVNLMMHDAF